MQRYSWRATAFPCERDLPRLFSNVPRGTCLNIRGRVRIDLPRYRVRGLCTIRATPAGDIRIDFHHSSLFGSYREDATIFLRGGKLGILDRERSAFFGNDSTLALLRDHLGIELFPDDIAHVLLLACPDCAEMDASSLEYAERGDAWRFSGLWRGRRIEIRGRTGGEPVSFRQCSGDDDICYIAHYQYDGGETPERYPGVVAVSREYGAERLVLTVRDVRREYVSDGVFELFDSLMR